MHAVYINLGQRYYAVGTFLASSVTKRGWKTYNICSFIPSLSHSHVLACQPGIPLETDVHLIGCWKTPHASSGYAITSMAIVCGASIGKLPHAVCKCRAKSTKQPRPTPWLSSST